MRVLLIRPLIEKGGAGIVITRLARGLLSHDIDISIASSGGELLSDINEEVSIYKIPLFPTSYKNLLFSIIKLRDILSKNHYDLINSHHRFSTLVCNLTPKPYPVTIISTFHEIKNDKTRLSKLYFGHYTYVFSLAVKNNLIENYKINPDRISIVTMGIPDENSSGKSNLDKKELLGIDNSFPIISNISRLSEEKGPSYLLKAISELDKKGLNANYIFVGDGPLKDKLINEAKSLKCSDRIYFLGWQTNIRDIIQVSDFLVLPSLSESFGMTILEGWLHGKTTIASNVGGIPEIISDGYNGLLVPSAQPEELAKAISYLIKEPNQAQLLGENGKLTLNKKFRYSIMISDVIYTYNFAINLSNKKKSDS